MSTTSADPVSWSALREHHKQSMESITAISKFVKILLTLILMVVRTILVLQTAWMTPVTRSRIGLYHLLLYIAFGLPVAYGMVANSWIHPSIIFTLPWAIAFVACGGWQAVVRVRRFFKPGPYQTHIPRWAAGDIRAWLPRLLRPLVGRRADDQRWMAARGEASLMMLAFLVLLAFEASLHIVLGVPWRGLFVLCMTTSLCLLVLAIWDAVSAAWKRQVTIDQMMEQEQRAEYADSLMGNGADRPAEGRAQVPGLVF